MVITAGLEVDMALPNSSARPYPPIDDYAIIGNCRTSALVSREGSIDWLCLPRFDSPSYFAALLDSEQGGRFQIAPAEIFSCERAYIHGTPVLETTFQCATGKLVLRDLFAVGTEKEKQSALTPSHELLRELEVIEGEVPVEIFYQPRPGYALSPPTLEDRGSLGVWCPGCGGKVVLRSEIPLSLSDSGREAIAGVTLRQGERRWLSLSFSFEAPAVIPPLGKLAAQKYARSLRWWERWESRCSYRGRYYRQVLRSAIVLKLMIYAPSGAIVAAPTTSLPEKIGGVRNWDYRYCWLRDATLTLRALFSLGYTEDEQGFVDWMSTATRLTWPELQVLYDVYGEAHLPETELKHLDGYAHSRPVRVGNKAKDQFQLDVYGEVVEAMFTFANRGGKLDRTTMRMLNGLGKTVCKRWRQPDDGIWEIRAGSRHHTYSKVLAWVALDRLTRLSEMGYDQLSADFFKVERDQLRQEIETRGYNRELQSYTSTYDSKELDASLLLLPVYGYISASDPRMRSTYALIREKLGRGSLLYRYGPDSNDGLPPGEGTFGICAFWGVECQARSGDLAGAVHNFEELLTYGNDLGLFAEEISPQGEGLGNFPQAFTHVGLINAALTLAELEGK
jgi:GH15 family glucan-1,4-alpha-glucosidase